MSKAFDGITVVDFTQVLAGPFATQQLALLGADVIKIEQPGKGDQARHLFADERVKELGMAPAYLSVNAGKRAITVDLKAPEAKEIIHRLVAKADVVAQNFKAGVMERLGFGYEDLRQIKQDLIYCAISGYGQQGPKSGVAAYDGAIQAASGMMSGNGHPETGPTRTGYMVVDMSTGLTATIAICGALYRRAVTGEGQYLDVAMMDTALTMQATLVARTAFSDAPLPLNGNASPTGLPTADVFPAKDGYIQVTALTDSQVTALFHALDLAAQLEDPRFADNTSRLVHFNETKELLRQAFRKRSKNAWIALLSQAAVPVAAINTLSDAMADPQLAHRHGQPEFPIAGLDKSVRLPVTGYQANVDGPGTNLAPPRLGADTDAVLVALGYSETDIAQLRRNNVV